jgi:hypothetical protein
MNVHRHDQAKMRDHGEAGAEARWSCAGGRQGTGSHRGAGEVHDPQFINSNALSERCSFPAGMCCSPCPIGARAPTWSCACDCRDRKSWRDVYGYFRDV